MNVLHINYSDDGGGAELIVSLLARSQERSFILVKDKHSQESHIDEVKPSLMDWVHKQFDKVLWKIGVKSTFRDLLGYPDALHFSFHQIRNLDVFKRATVVHLHNIHGNFFDLSAVLHLSKFKPVIWTSHDAWLMTGGEGGIIQDSFLDRPKNMYPYRKGWVDTRNYWRRYKLRVILKGKENITLVAPSYTHQKQLQEHFRVPVRCIYNGVDNTIFNCKSKKGPIPEILIFNSNNVYKNSEFVIEALEQVNCRFILNVLGMPLNKTLTNAIEINNHGVIKCRVELSKIFQKIHVAVFCSRSETFGLIPVEAASCGALVFLNKWLPVFKEHGSLYGAELYDSKETLVQLLNESLTFLDKTIEQGEKSSAQISTTLTLIGMKEEYDLVYKEAIRKWNKE